MRPKRHAIRARIAYDLRNGGINSVYASRKGTVLEPYYDQLQILGYVGVAMFLGALIGLERELEQKPAGLRTHMLVAGGSALFVALGDVMVKHFAQDIQADIVRSDPIRIMQAIVTGVSFLGAGTILRDRSQHRVEGLTTAASILFASAMGAAIPLDQFVLAFGATLFALVTLRVLGMVENRLQRFAPRSRDE